MGRPALPPAQRAANIKASKARYQASTKGKAARVREKAARVHKVQTPAQKAAGVQWRVGYLSTPWGRAKNMVLAAKQSAKRKRLTFDLEWSDITIPTHCPLLGIPLDCAAKPHAPNLPSLDRIDNTKGYTRGNVWVISWKANRHKGDLTLTELEMMTRALRVALEGQSKP